MYIAFKWLTTLAVAMWLGMCIIDYYVKNINETSKTGVRMGPFGWPYNNVTLQLHQDEPQRGRKLNEKKNRRYDTTLLHYTMFFAGAIAVSVFNKKNEIISFTKNTISKVDLYPIMKIIITNSKKTAILCHVAISKYSTVLWVLLIRLVTDVKTFKRGMQSNVIQKHKRLNIILLKKLKEMGEEQRKLGQLLIAAIHENKNIRMQFQLETMAKNRLMRHIQDTQNKIKESRSKYFNFQNLYLVSQQENIFLKARIRKLTTEKEKAEKDVMTIINEVYQSKNGDLKAFCSRFIVRPKHNLLNGDASAEVQKFLKTSCYSAEATSSWQVSNHTDESKLSHIENARDPKLFLADNSLVPIAAVSPKLKGLPGECILTVKDKDGVIEKLYEYDYDSDFDNGDTIRRIREYSVYYDKDCLLDFASSRTPFTEPIPFTLSNLYPASGRFLTGSEAFQKFMQQNRNVPPLRSCLPPLLY